MGLIQSIIAKFRNRNEQEKALEQQLQIEKRVTDKMKSANERELERYSKEAREKMIENRLKFERAKRSKEIWKTNLMKNNAKCYVDNSIMREKKNFLRGGFRTW